MGRVFCLPVFSRRNKVKLDYKTGNVDESSYHGSPAVVKVASSTEQSNSSCYEESVVHPELASVKDSAVAEALEDLETEILTGHLSDPGLYCVEDREYSGSCTTSECSGKLPLHGEEYRADGNVAFVAHEVAEEIQVEKVTLLTLEDDQSSGMKRVEEWVRSIDTLAEPLIEPPTEASDGAASEHHSRTSAAQRELEFANALIRSLDFHTSVAHLNGVGLSVVPCLGAFSHLKTLKLSGNSIARIAPGALPRGLHTLDLSRNKISVVEGLRELTRLRCLNLSYNRILRIGQGLANCGSVRELHLACNKISEVEGLHRLGKLAFLDLSYNRLSSTKSLGQIAATYTSLMAINLIGNPVMVNIGEEQVKRFITGVAPNLIYLNNQAVKGGGSTRDAVVRSLIGSSATSSSRHSPHNVAGSNKAKRTAAAAAAAAAAPAHRPKDRKEPSSSKPDHRSSTSRTLKSDFSNLDAQERLLARIQGIQRVRSDGALHERDV